MKQALKDSETDSERDRSQREDTNKYKERNRGAQAETEQTDLAIDNFRLSTRIIRLVFEID